VLPLPAIAPFSSGVSLIDVLSIALLLTGVGLLVVLSQARRIKALGRVFGSTRTRLTLEGKVFLALTGVMCAGAVNTGINLMYLVAGLMLSVIILSMVFARGVQKIDLTRAAPLRASAGEPALVRLTLRNRRRRLTVFTVVAQDHVSGPEQAAVPPLAALQLRAGAAHTLACRCKFPRRGVYRFTHVTLKSRFPFGLFEMQCDRRIEHEILVHPAIGRIRELPGGHSNHVGQLALRVTADGQDEFSHLREYRPDDNPRRIHWRTSARHRELHVMEFRGLPSMTAEIRFDPALGGTSAEELAAFEKAARFAATVADHLASRDYSIRFSFDGTRPLAGPGKRILPDILDSLARLEPDVGGSHSPEPGEGVAELKVRISAGGACFVRDRLFVASASDPELDRWFADWSPQP